MIEGDFIKISIIIPAFNSEKYIRRCLNPLKKSINTFVEVIVVNDGSTDNTEQIVKDEFPEVKIVTIENGGAAHARNVGLSIVCGDYIMFLDADDAYDDNLIDDAIRLIDKHDCDIIQFPLKYIYENGNILLEKFLFKTNTFINKNDFKKNVYFKMMTGICFNSLCRNIYKRSLFNDLSFDETLKTAEDLLMNIEVFTRAKNMFYTTEIMYNYYIRGNSLTGNSLSTREKADCNKIIGDIMCKFLPEWQMDNLIYKVLIRFRLFFIALSKIPRVIKQKLKSKD